MLHKWSERYNQELSHAVSTYYSNSSYKVGFDIREYDGSDNNGS